MKNILRTLFYQTINLIFFILQKLFFFIKPQNIPNNIKTIVLMKFERIGDTVLSTATINAVKTRFPKAKIYLMLPEYICPLFQHDPNIDKLMPFKIKYILNIVTALNKEKTDILVDLTTRDTSLWGVLFASLIKNRLSIGLNHHNRGVFFNIKVPPQKDTIHMSKEIMNIVSYLDITPEEIAPKIYICPNSQNSVKIFLNKHNPDNLNIVSVHPFGFYRSQHWQIENYSQIIKYLMEKYNFISCIISSSKEYDLVHKLTSITSVPIINITNKLDIAELAALINESKLFIGSNSGPMHIAEGLDIPTIVITGPTINDRWKPLNHNSMIIEKELPCKPCPGHCIYTKYRCIEDISINTVISSIDQIMRKLGYAK